MNNNVLSNIINDTLPLANKEDQLQAFALLKAVLGNKKEDKVYYS